MALTIAEVSDATQEAWRRIHNEIFPASPLTTAEVAERRGHRVDGAEYVHLLRERTP